jgi:hypothetical protein
MEVEARPGESDRIRSGELNTRLDRRAGGCAVVVARQMARPAAGGEAGIEIAEGTEPSAHRGPRWPVRSSYLVLTTPR